MAERGQRARVSACPRCQTPFQLPESFSDATEHLPRLLDCEHVFCDQCLLTIHCTESNFIICPSCQVSTPVIAEIGVEGLPLDNWIIGTLCTEKILLNTKTRSEEPGVGNKEKNKVNEESELDITERNTLCQKRQKFMSKEDTELGISCFEKICYKQEAKNLTPSPPTPESFSKLGIIRGDTKDSVFPELLFAHKEHQDNFEINVQSSDFCQVYDQDRIYNLIQRLEDSSSSIENNCNKIRKELHKEFEKIVRAVQNRKAILLKEIETISQHHLDGIANVRKILEEKTSVLDSAIDPVESRGEFIRASSDTKQIIENLDEVHTIVEALETRIDLRFRIQTEPLLIAFAKLGKIELGKQRRFPSSRTEKKLPCEFIGKTAKQNHLPREENKAVSQAENGSLNREKGLLNNWDSLYLAPQIVPSQDVDVVVEQIIEDYQIIVSDLMDRKNINLPRPMSKRQKRQFQKKRVPNTISGCQAGFQALVSVSHVINPCHFYIQKSSEKKKASLLASEATNFCNNVESQKIPIPALELGERIIVKSNLFCTWCRGIITELVPSEENEEKPNGPTRYRITEVAVMQVFLLDIGHSEIFVVTGFNNLVKKLQDGIDAYSYVNDLSQCVRKLGPEVKGVINTTPPLAIKCSLKDIVPPNFKNRWSVEARDEFIRMVDNKTVQMLVLGEDGDKLLVDLKKPPPDKMGNNVPVSLRDALVFLDLARFVSEYSVPPLTEENNMKHDPAVIPPLLENIQVMITHVNDPSDFYIQLADTVKLIILTKKMFEVYTEKNVRMEILCPVVGQACAAMFEDGGWYRCQINSLTGHREVDVKYVDFGNTARIPITAVRKIKGDFLTLPIQALQCRLADVEPTNRTEGWDDFAKERLKELTLNKYLWCCITSTSLGNLSVQLYESTGINGTKSCINNKLVEEGLACFTQCLNFTDVSAMQSNKASTSIKQVDEVGEADVASDITYCCKSEETDYAIAGLGGIASSPDKHVEVKITYVASPSSIFVQLLSSQSLVTDLQEKIKSEYSSSEADIEWEESMHCALLVFENKEWRRGKVTKVNLNKTAEVFCYDFGNKELVNICMLKKLKEDIQTIRPLAMECSLSEIKPAGGSSKWAATSCDFLKEILVDASVVIDIEETSSNCPHLVKLYCKDEIGQFINIAQYLIKKGLALPHKIPTTLDTTALDATVVKTDMKQLLLDQAPEIDGPSAANHQECLEFKKVYKPPVLPNVNIFEVEVTGVGDDGVIYGIRKSLQEEFTMLTSAIQASFKILPLLKPYCYSKGEGCVVKGSDTLWYRGKILEVIGVCVKVYYVDNGYIETIPHVHVYPMVMYPEIPELCLPFQLYGVEPVGNKWQEDAVDLLRELLLQRNLEVEIMDPPESSTHTLVADLHFDGMSVAYFMVHHKHAVQIEKTSIITKRFCSDLNDGGNLPEECWNMTFEGLISPRFETPILPGYDYPLLPLPGKVFPVTVKHLETPNWVYICIDQRRDSESDSDMDRGLKYEPEDDNLDKALRDLNPSAERLPLLTDFRSEMPCLAEYDDGRWYRAKVLSVDNLHPLKILVQHVDFGSSASLPESRLRQLPIGLMQYPARAIRVKLMGFKPPASMNNLHQLVYCPEWSMEALWTMIDIVQGSQLTALLVSLYPDVSVFLYEEGGSLIHLPLVEKGFANLDM
uniref:RING finger protein 17 n=1 Tax=Callorhinchus milii TaxID=7868 RepID=A0A4W3HK33_CALMI